jgi:hypothetical protein
MKRYTYSIQETGFSVLKKFIGASRNAYFMTQAIRFEDENLKICEGLSVKVENDINSTEGWLNLFTQVAETDKYTSFDCLHCLFESKPQFISLGTSTLLAGEFIKGPISEIDLSYLGALKGVEVVYNEEIWRDECINYDTGLLFQFEKGDALLCCLPANFEMKFYLQPHRIAKEMEKLKLRGGVNLSTS